MGVEVAGFEKVQAPVEVVTVGDNVEKKENGKLDQVPSSHEPIKFGSHGEEPTKKEENGVSRDANFPKNAADEWPVQKQVHSFYLVRFRPYDDPKIKSKIDQASIENEKRTQARLKITEQLKAKRADRHELISQIKALNSDNRQIRSLVGEKIKEIEPLHQALGKLRNANNATRGVCSSEEELNSIIHSLQYRIQHESIPLSEEKQILREIKQLESTRPQVIANAAVRAKIQDSMAQKEALQDQVKVIGGDLDGVRKEQQLLKAKIKQIDDEVKAIDKDIAKLQDELAAVTEKRDKARDSIQQFRKQREDENSYFYQSRSILNKAKDLASKKDVPTLEEFANAEVGHFMSLWNGNKSFRDDYEKRILSSLDARQLSRDGRMRNPDEKPLVAVEQPAPANSETVVEAIPKRAKELPTPTPAADALPSEKVQKDAKSKSKNSKPSVDNTDVEEDEVVVSDKLPVEPPKKKVDAAALKEMKRQEEIAKAKQAMERKKKLAEKAAAKAAIRAQKDAEKKIKEREKKLKKKAGASAADPNTDEGAEADTEVVEAEKENENVEAPPLAPVKERVYRETTSVRMRGRARGPESIPKAILKRKKATNYWLWAAPAAAVLTLVFVAVGYRYFL